MAQEKITAPVPGLIVSVEAKVGDKVAEGDTICVLESMKMQNPILAPLSGTVTQINVKPQQVIETEDLIAVIDY